MKFLTPALLALTASSMPALASHITVKSPANGATVTSPFTVAASATSCSGGSVLFMTYSIDGGGFTVEPAAFSVSVSASPGKHVLAVACYGPNGQEQVSLTVNVGSSSSKSTTATPRFSVASGTYTHTQTVFLSDTTSGATIYYTTDGSGPTTLSAVYTGPIAVSHSMVIEAMAAAPGYKNSGLARASYTIKGSSGGGGSGPSIPSNAVAVRLIQKLPNWTAVHDAGTAGTSTGITSLTSSPSLSGTARKFDSSYTHYGGERYNVHLSADTTSTHFVYDAQIYIPSGSSNDIANLEMDLNQVMPNGQRVIYGFQCDAWSHTWDYADSAGYIDGEGRLRHWVHSNQTCDLQQWSANTWHRVQIQYSRDDSGNLTYTAVWLDGVEQDIDVTVPGVHPAGWAPQLSTNFQVDGSSSTAGTSTIYLDQLTLYKW